jgi:hypothetical protein
MAEPGPFSNRWHPTALAFRATCDQLNVSFARYVLTRLLVQCPEIVEKMYIQIIANWHQDTRHRTSMCGKGDCLLYGDITSGARSTIRASISFQDDLPPRAYFQADDGRPRRFAFTVQHVVWIYEHRVIPNSDEYTMVHFCHIRNCCNSLHFYWNSDAENRSRDVCRIRGFSFIQFRKRCGHRIVLNFCRHRPSCLIFKKEGDYQPERFRSADGVPPFVLEKDL